MNLYSKGYLSLKTENMLHPLDAFTTDMFNKGEVSYNQPIAPSPGWAWWGVTDWLTVELDLQCWLGGVASFNVRLGSIQQNGVLPSIAFETMYQYLPRDINLLGDYEYMWVERKGHHWYNRINLGWTILSDFQIYVSGGATYTDKLVIENKNRSTYHGKEYNGIISPDISMALSWRARSWLSVHATASYGVTFVYLDNVSRKYQATFGFRMAPFIDSKYALLRSLRLEPIFI